jgi:hypothetical protein
MFEISVRLDITVIDSGNFLDGLAGFPRTLTMGIAEVIALAIGVPERRQHLYL